MYWVKNDLFGCFKIEEIREKDNKTDLKEGGVVEMSTTVLLLRDARSPSLCIYLPIAVVNPLRTASAFLR